MVLVRATKLGFDGMQRRFPVNDPDGNPIKKPDKHGRNKAGQPFEISEALFSKNWMEKVDPDGVPIGAALPGREHLGEIKSPDEAKVMHEGRAMSVAEYREKTIGKPLDHIKKRRGRPPKRASEKSMLED